VGGVVGVDLSPALVAEARVRGRAAGLSERLSFEVADVRDLPHDAGEFDWAWSANCVGYGVPDPVAAAGELARVVQPGGLVALLVWSFQTLLPGHPRLEARLNATGPGLAPYRMGQPPKRHHLFGLGLLRQVGLLEARARTFVGEAHAPLAGPVRAALAALVAMRWPGAEEELSEEDAAEFQRLCGPGSAEFIVDDPDYDACFTETLFWGRRGRTDQESPVGLSR
jgi:SAM-dependent methyltransferase